MNRMFTFSGGLSAIVAFSYAVVRLPLVVFSLFRLALLQTIRLFSSEPVGIKKKKVTVPLKEEKEEKKE